jgi:predicted O-methyltransferase YrrM
MTQTVRPDDEAYVETLYRVILKRVPAEKEKLEWLKALSRGLSDREIFRSFCSSSEYAAKNRVIPGHPIGHYCSPVIDPEEVRKYLKVDHAMNPEAIPGIAISMDNMFALWEKLAPFVATTKMAANKEERCRYYWVNDVYPIGDAAILRAMILLQRPRRIIEIGSGFSSACMLDTVEEGGLEGVKLTFIEPYPDRLKSLLREADLSRCEIIESPVQAVDLDLFRQLDANDILFIDSSHVMKTASDVNFELFEVLPCLKQGVLIHFHDIMYPFEYPNEWIFDRKYSWNEIYALRAFLMYNDVFRIEFFTSLFERKYHKLIRETYAPIMVNPGAGLWIRKIGD